MAVQPVWLPVINQPLLLITRLLVVQRPSAMLLFPLLLLLLLGLVHLALLVLLLLQVPSFKQSCKQSFLLRQLLLRRLLLLRQLLPLSRLPLLPPFLFP